MATAVDLAEAYLPQRPSKAAREVLFRGQETDQVRDSDLLDIYLRHTARDSTLMPWGIQKRIRWREKEAFLDLMEGTVGGAALSAKFQEICQTGSLPFDEELFIARQRRSYANMLEKDKYLNKSKAFKCDPALPESYAEILLKQQDIKKIGKIYSQAKAPQILTEHAHRVALDMAPVFMYMLYRLQAHLTSLGSGIFLYPGHSEEELIQFLNERWDHGVLSMEDDATAWDSNVNAPCIQFELYLFDFFQIPPPYKERFYEYKTEMRCVAGAIAFMMFSGGPDTLPFNTILSCTLQNVIYDIKPTTAQLYGGDDVAINEDLKQSKPWRAGLHTHFTQEFKTRRTYKPQVFGWTVAPAPHKDVETILGRFLFSIGKQNLPNTLPGLLADINRLSSPEVMEQLSEDDMDKVVLLASLAEKFRVHHHLAKTGVTPGKTGARRRYSSENIASLAIAF